MPDLFQPGLIERLDGVVDGLAVAVPNGSEARWARDASGRQWVRKREAFTGVNGLLAEAACHLLGRELELRQPNGAVFCDGQGWSWMSERIPAVSEHWSPDLRDLLLNVEEVGRMLALDAIVSNADRHQRNMLVQPVGDAIHLRLWSIDFGDALIGWPVDFINLGLDTRSPHIGGAGLPIAALKPAALVAAQVASQLPDDKLHAIVAEACGLAGEPDVDSLAAALIARCRAAPSLVSSYLDALGARP